MREVRRSALVPYSVTQMFALVADVERYPEFLPWLETARVLTRDGEWVTASLALRQATFTTRNRLVQPEFLEVSLLDGPFRTLEGRWDFRPIGVDGSRVELAVRFEMQSAITSLVVGPTFERVCNQLVDAFGKRAKQVYG
jgi:ribosome-associated toxin RatA of RatAB toxin-antitoxin module